MPQWIFARDVASELRQLYAEWRNEGKKHNSACFVAIQLWRHKSVIRNQISLGISLNTNNVTFTRLIQLSMNTITVKFPFAARYIRELDAFLTKLFACAFPAPDFDEWTFSIARMLLIQWNRGIHSRVDCAKQRYEEGRVHNNTATCNRDCLTNTFPSFVSYRL